MNSKDKSWTQDWICTITVGNISVERFREVERYLSTLRRRDPLEENPISIEYHEGYCIDRTGDRRLLGLNLESKNKKGEEEDGEITEEQPLGKKGGSIGLLEISDYERVFDYPLPIDPKQNLFPSAKCFNCGRPDHSMRDCPKPRNQVNINNNRKLFNESKPSASQTDSRYFESGVHEFTPGILSPRLKDALGMKMGDLPPFFERMKRWGFPPGYLGATAAPVSGLKIIDGNEEEHAKPHLAPISSVIGTFSPAMNFAYTPPPSDYDSRFYPNYGQFNYQYNHQQPITPLRSMQPHVEGYPFNRQDIDMDLEDGEIKKKN